MSEPLLVIGATGAIGSLLVQDLLQRGARIRILARDPAKAAGLGSAVDVVRGDLTKPETLGPAFEGIRKAFVLAPPQPDAAELEANAFDAAEQAGTRHITYLSNFGAGEFDHPIWEWHGASEARLRNSAMAWTMLRPTRFMGVMPFTWLPIAEGGTLLESMGEGRSTLIDPQDIAAVAAEVMSSPGHEGQVYELTSAEHLHGTELAAQLGEVLGRDIAYVGDDPEGSRKALIRTGFPDFVADAALTCFRTVSEGRWYPTSAVSDLLGRPARSFTQWLSDNAAHVRTMASGASPPVNAAQVK